MKGPAAGVAAAAFGAAGLFWAARLPRDARLLPVEPGLDLTLWAISAKGWGLDWAFAALAIGGLALLARGLRANLWALGPAAAAVAALRSSFGRLHAQFPPGGVGWREPVLAFLAAAAAFAILARAAFCLSGKRRPREAAGWTGALLAAAWLLAPGAPQVGPEDVRPKGARTVVILGQEDFQVHSVPVLAGDDALSAAMRLDAAGARRALLAAARLDAEARAALVENLLRAPSGAFRPEAEELLDPARWRLDPSVREALREAAAGSIEGRVPGFAGALVGLYSAEGLGGAFPLGPSRLLAAARAAQGGGFRFEGLKKGRYFLALSLARDLGKCPLGSGDPPPCLSFITGLPGLLESDGRSRRRLADVELHVVER